MNPQSTCRPRSAFTPEHDLHPRPAARRLALRLRHALAALALLVLASPAAAQWTRVPQLPASNVFTVRTQGDTVLACADTSVFVSLDAGATWHPSRSVAGGAGLMMTATVHNGRLYAGTAGQGVFESDDLGATWQTFNEGLTGGLFDSQLDVSTLLVRGDSLYAATFGAGVYVRKLAAGGTWSHFGEAFEPNQASNVVALALGGTRLLAGAGGNGSVFHRDSGEPEWVISWLDNVGLHPGIQAQSVFFTGNGWLVSTLVGVFHSVAGEEPWTLTDLGIGVLRHGAFATRGGQLFGAFDALNAAEIETSDDDGVTWQPLDDLPGVFVISMAAIGNDLYAGRTDGLWRRSIATASVPDAAASGMRLRLAGRQPAGDDLRFIIELPQPGSASLELFDVTGRRAAEPVRGSWGAGTHDVSLDARRLPPGVYEAMLTTGQRRMAVRVVHVR